MISIETCDKTINNNNEIKKLNHQSLKEIRELFYLMAEHQIKIILEQK